MIEQLRKIRKSVDEQLRRLPLVQDALLGKVGVNTYSHYLASVANQYAHHSPKVMCLAASRCINTHPELGQYLLKHAAEERSHNEWAHDDLCDQKVTEKEIQESHAVPACAAMIGYTYYLAGYANPIAIYGWMYILEAVGADLGPDALNGLQKQGVSVRFVGGHSTADQKHTQEIEDAIKQYVVSNQDQADVVQAAEVIADLYVRMFEQVQIAK